MEAQTVLLLIVALGLAVYTIVSVWNDVSLRIRMKRKERELREAGVTPYGSSLSHGMYIDNNTGEICSDSKESLIWYKRLLN